MDEIFIHGIGIISNLGNSVDTVWSMLCSRDVVKLDNGPVKFESELSLSQKNKINRYSQMAIVTAHQAFMDAENKADISLNKLDRKRIGTIYTTGYGPIVSTIDFARSASQGNTAFCSPVLFANTVTNSCVGHLCISLGLKGVSTIFTGGNNLEYVQMLLWKGSADYILTGALEEYCEELNRSFSSKEITSDIQLKEAAVTLLVSTRNDVSRYCRVVAIYTCGLEASPLVSRLDEASTDNQISTLLEKVLAQYEPDACFDSANGTYFDAFERHAMDRLIGTETIRVSCIKTLVGETLGASFNINVLVAALCLSHGYLPSQLDPEMRKVKSILVTGYDLIGNYMACVLENN